MKGYGSHIVNSSHNTLRKVVPAKERGRDHQRLRDSMSRVKATPAVWLTDEEMSHFVKQLNATPRDAREEYARFIRDVKSARDRYVKCIDAELAKDDLSEFAEVSLLYAFLEAGDSIGGPQTLTKLTFLRIFKEFILDADGAILPDLAGNHRR